MLSLLKEAILMNGHIIVEEENAYYLSDNNGIIKEVWFTNANKDLHEAVFKKVYEMAGVQENNILIILMNDCQANQLNERMIDEVKTMRKEIESDKDICEISVPFGIRSVYSVGKEFRIVGDICDLRDEILQDLEVVGFNRKLAEYISIEEESSKRIEKIIGEYKNLNKHIDVLLEVGSFIGVSTIILAYLGADAKIIAVDPNLLVTSDAEEFGVKQDERCRTYFDVIYENKYKYLLKQRIHRYDAYFSSYPSEEVVELKGKYENMKDISILDESVIEEKIDIAFIDGEHTEKGVSSDLLKVAPKMKDTGIMVLHDMQGYWGKRVRRGINIFLNENKDYFLKLDSNNSEIGVISKKDK